MSDVPASGSLSEKSIAHALAVTLTGDSAGVSVRVRTAWIEHSTPGDSSIEVRAASSGNDAGHWTWMGDAHLVVGAPAELAWFLASGGHALLERTLAERWWPVILEPIRCTQYYAFMPFYSLDRLPPWAHDRKVRGELRQWIFQRDGDRCRVCNRSPDDALDLVLNVHHVTPVELGGLTVEHNLIVLCATCHDGMAADNIERRGDLQEKIAVAGARSHRERHLYGVRRYRSFVRRAFPRADDLPAPVLPLNWGYEADLPLTLREIYKILSYNDVLRWYPRRAWTRIAARVNQIA